MKTYKQVFACIGAIICLLLLIFNSQTAIEGVQEGIWVCINTVIPSLFPFFVVSTILNTLYSGRNMKILRPVGRVCRIPPGGEVFLLLGCLGGFPVGALSIYDAYKENAISKNVAIHLLGFCNNAGPAFIFGMAASIFPNKICGFLLWFIVFSSSIITGMLLPKTEERLSNTLPTKHATITGVLEKSINAIISVCGWVVLFKVVLAFVETSLLGKTSTLTKVIVTNILELSNGCIALSDLPNEGLRFLICAASVSFGGICVSMQTASAVRELGTGLYFPGKLIQTSISTLMAYLLQFFLFAENNRLSLALFPYIIAIAFLVIRTQLIVLKNSSRYFV